MRNACSAPPPHRFHLRCDDRQAHDTQVMRRAEPARHGRSAGATPNTAPKMNVSCMEAHPWNGHYLEVRIKVRKSL